MNAITVTPKVIETVPARTENVSQLVWATQDDPFNSVLRIVVNGRWVILIKDQEYANLGQWTDDTIKSLVLSKYGLTESAQ
jgi:hypothetical protein